MFAVFLRRWTKIRVGKAKRQQVAALQLNSLPHDVSEAPFPHGPSGTVCNASRSAPPIYQSTAFDVPDLDILEKIHRETPRRHLTPRETVTRIYGAC